MNCPNCGTENADTSRFCLNCGNQLSTETQQYVPPQRTPSVQDPISQAATIGGIAGIAGGSLTILGWLLPWFNLGGLLNTALGFLDFLGGTNLPNLGSGVGNGLQLSFFSLIGGVAMLTEGETAVLGIFVIVLAAVLISIPILGGMNIRTGIRLFEERSSAGKTPQEIRFGPMTKYLHDIRGRSTAIFVIMLVIFIIFSLIPFLTGILASGFYLTALGAVGSFFGVLYSKSQVK